MSFDKLIAKVRQAENALEAHERKVSADVRQLQSSWLAAWTPGRIVVAGLAMGFLAGNARPRRALDSLGGLRGTRWIQLAGMLSSVFASLQSAVAATKADDAADQAGEAVDQADAAVASTQSGTPPPGSGSGRAPDVEPEPPPRVDRRRPDPAWTTPPAPAEAATDVSER